MALPQYRIVVGKFRRHPRHQQGADRGRHPELGQGRARVVQLGLGRHLLPRRGNFVFPLARRVQRVCFPEEAPGDLRVGRGEAGGTGMHPQLPEVFYTPFPFQVHVSTLMRKLYESVSFDVSQTTQHVEILKTALALQWACTLNFEGCVSESVERFSAFRSSAENPNVPT